MAKKIQSKKQKLSECCKAPMIGGVQCENCGSDGKFSKETAVVQKLEKIIDILLDSKQPATVQEKSVDGRFIDCGDGTIKDTKTGLQWQKQGSQERLTYAQAEQFVADLNKEEYPDWRLPTIEELFSLVDFKRHDPAIDPIFKCEAAGYWSNTPHAGYTDDAWSVDFNDGYVSSGNRNGNFYVRPVRQY